MLLPLISFTSRQYFVHTVGVQLTLLTLENHRQASTTTEVYIYEEL